MSEYLRRAIWCEYALFWLVRLLGLWWWGGCLAADIFRAGRLLRAPI